ncbi:acyltransferase 3 [Mycena maculata]|uniref:Acyltransferase 3 n=1 Tax=Mycena maculata TaxID=230809 RepID=A0AAD7NC91_9AGAR|nr:acyltransferase 3 [Mycena maculata]
MTRDDPDGELAALLPRLIADMRIHFLDNLRTALTALVIFHHAALPFGGIGYWEYSSPYHAQESSWLLVAFVAVNQSYFMGMLFFLSGHFSAIAVQRKEMKTFCLDKIRRLGIPVVVYTLFLHPIVIVLVRWSEHAPIFPAVLGYWGSLRGARGPVWYLATLLFFDLVYAIRVKFLPPFSFLLPTSAGRYKFTAALCILIVTVTSFFVRMSYPVGRASAPLGLQLGYAPQYVLAYISGTCLSYIQQYLLVSHPARDVALAYLGAIFSLGAVWLSSQGGANLAALIYAIWNECCFYFIGTTLFSFFHSSPYTTKKWGSSARYSYGAYLIHPIVVVSLQIMLDKSVGRSVDGVIKMLVVGTAGTCISWAAAWAVIRIPGVGRVI